MILRPLLAAFPLLLSACAMQNHSYVSNEPMQVREEQISHDMPADHVSRGALDYIADDVNRRATGDVSVTVHYQLKNPLKATQKLAETQGSRVKAYLQKEHVRRPVRVFVEPDQEEAVNRITISYSALKAVTPANCMDITHADADRFDHGTDSGYYYGCTDDRYLSEMIARPGDLLGNDTASGAESQRLGKALETYRSGERLTPQGEDGVSASDVYTQ